MGVAASNHSYCGIGERTWYLEWLRVSACLAVVLIHCFTTLLDNASIDEVGIFRALAWTEVLVVFCRWAVPVFLMVTGSLLLDPARRVTWNKNLWYVFRVATVLLTFGTMFALMELVFSSKDFEVSMVPAAIGNVLQGRGWAHFWYLYDLLGIYLLLPLLRAFAAASTREDMRRMLVVLFIFSLAVPTLNAAVGLDASTFIWLGSSAFYVMLGRYLSAYNIRVAPVLLAGAVFVVLQALLAGGASLSMELTFAGCGLRPHLSLPSGQRPCFSYSKIIWMCPWRSEGSHAWLLHAVLPSTSSIRCLPISSTRLWAGARFNCLPSLLRLRHFLLCLSRLFVSHGC